MFCSLLGCMVGLPSLPALGLPHHHQLQWTIHTTTTDIYKGRPRYSTESLTVHAQFTVQACHQPGPTGVAIYLGLVPYVAETPLPPSWSPPLASGAAPPLRL